MKATILSITIFLFSFTAFTQNNKKAIFVIVDGIPADLIEKLETPNLDAIAKVGGYTRAHVGGEKGTYSQSPTISAVGYNHLLTGVWTNKHNVWDNDIKDPNYHYWTIFRFLKQEYPQKKAAVFSSWLDNRTKLVGEGLSQTGKLQLDYHFDGLELDTVNYPHDKDANYMHRIDEAVVDNAAEYIRTESPDLSWVYLEYTDDMGHKYGDGPEFYRAIGLMDKQMGRLWEAIQYRERTFKENWVIYITTDHGRDSATGRNHGGQSTRERGTWIVTNAKGLNDYFKTGNPGVVDIMPSIAKFMNVHIPKDQLMEVDGIPLTGRLSAIAPVATIENGKLKLSWKALDKKGNAKIWVANTNNFKTDGSKDEYKLMATVPVSKQSAIIDLKNTTSDFYKIYIEMPENSLVRWVVKEAAQQ
ncbi:alkaline phosphatase family protein [Pollutibacter soli]|uniref:alkaline phosphatase family protein n=1 Tax=Pollutibacter soli TaxID=3034157 RepID=UPI0030138892